MQADEEPNMLVVANTVEVNIEAASMLVANTKAAKAVIVYPVRGECPILCVRRFCEG
jgi:hypothetical protein